MYVARGGTSELDVVLSDGPFAKFYSMEIILLCF